MLEYQSMQLKQIFAFGALSFLLLISGCSQTDLALRYADQFIAWELKDQFGFTGAQKQKIDELSKQGLSQLKKEFLPEVIEEMTLVKAEFLQKNWSEQNTEEGARFLNEKRLKFKILGQKSLKIISRQTSEFASATQEKNWQIFLKNFKEKNQEILDS
ncbi:MAG: hypothetical protein ACK5V3_05725, partial [Bdellovibrionales bacterium]